MLVFFRLLRSASSLVRPPPTRPAFDRIPRAPLRLFSSRGFDHESDETLESLCERFEELLDDFSVLAEGDVTLASGVLTVVVPRIGTYVINKQTPNQQIWLSSPKSGPARFDFTDERTWVYKHTGESLHQLLEREIGKELLEVEDAGFQKCHGGGREEED